MVRTCQFVTPEEKLLAKRERSRRYEHSVRGRATRNESHRRAYHKSTSRKGPSDKQALPDLPPSLSALASKTLPTSDLFLSTLHDTDLVDEADLDHWDHLPPYSPPSDRIFTTLYISNLIDVMHGRRLRAHREEERHRVETSQSLDLRAVKRMISGLLKAEMKEWDRGQQWLEKEGEFNNGDVCMTMANHFVQWSARRAKALHEQLEALGEGIETYYTLMHTRETFYSAT
ncbi:hypothetical protein HWV62_5071 [Athelia sp. TMB]|nr:hypothetical protein HWV62_5071 [Athelia sp. TMB]